MSDIKVVRLTTGEELICDVKFVDENIVQLSDIAILIPTQENSLGLAPFMAYTDASEGIAIQGKDIMFSCNPVEGLKQQYQNMFGKIVTQSSKIIS